MVSPCLHCKIKAKLKSLKQRHPTMLYLPFLFYKPFRIIFKRPTLFWHQRETRRYGVMVEKSIRHFQQLSATKRSQIMKDLTSYSLPAQGVKITLIGASRRLNNPNNRLDGFLSTVLNNTAVLSSIEVLVRIDSDDDLLYFHEVWKEFGSKVRIRFVVDDTVRGYENLFKLVSELLEFLADSSAVVFGFADDCLIIRKDWDLSFIQVIDSYPDNIFFINTLRDFTIPYENKQLFFWLMWHHGPPSLFSAVGRRVLEITKAIAKKYPGWTAYGNSVMCDSFFEALQLYIWELTGLRRAPVIPDTIIAQKDIAISPHKEGGLFSASPVAIRSNRLFLKDQTQNIIAEMAAEIVKAMKAPALQASTNGEVVISLIENGMNKAYLELFLEKLVTHTSYLPHIEILINVNAGDDALYRKIQTTFGNTVSIHFIYNDESKDGSLQLKHTQLLSKLAPSSKMVIFFDDNCDFILENWDDLVLNVAKEYSDGNFIINSTLKNNTTFYDKYLYFWELWRAGNSGYYPFISRQILELVNKKIASYPASTIASLNMVGSNVFYETLKFYLQEINSAYADQTLNIIDISGIPTPVSYDIYKEYLQDELQAVVREIAISVDRLATHKTQATQDYVPATIY
jgi:hypothetical protein